MAEWEVCLVSGVADGGAVPRRLSVGSGQKSSNPVTGEPEFFLDKILEYGSKFLGGGGGNFLQRAVGGIGSFVGGLFRRRENGGPVSKGRSYLVGERGPEMFTPSRSGRIVANNELGGTVVNVNVDASGSSVSGNAADAQALGAVIGAAVQAQLVKEKRAGGLLAR